MGGGDIIEGNLLANCVRESGDHGPWNSWDRVPYITTIGSGKPSVLPAWRHIRRNLMISNYASQEAIDNDDGSAFYKTYENFFVFAAAALFADWLYLEVVRHGIAPLVTTVVDDAPGLRDFATSCLER